MARMKLSYTTLGKSNSLDAASNNIAFLGIDATAQIKLRNTDGSSGATADVYANPTGGTPMSQPLNADDATGDFPGWVECGQRYNALVILDGVPRTVAFDAPDVGAVAGSGYITSVSDSTPINLGVSGGNLTADIFPNTLTGAHIATSATPTLAGLTINAGVADLVLSDAGTPQWQVRKNATQGLSLRDAVSGRSHFVLNQTGTTTINQRIDSTAAAPSVNPLGGMYGDGSNIAAVFGAALDGRYPNSAGSTQTTRFNISIAPVNGTNGVRNKLAGTIASTSATAVTGTGTTFVTGATWNGLKIAAVSVSAGVVSWYTATVSSVASTTALTVTAPGWTNHHTGATGVSVPSGSVYAVDPDTLDSGAAGSIQGYGAHYGTFWGAISSSSTHNTLGSLNMMDVYGTINDAAAGGTDGYGDLCGWSSHLTGNRRGALVTNEFFSTVNAGKQAKAMALAAGITDYNTYASYNDAAIFGATSSWRQSGSISIRVYNNSATVSAGTGVYITDAGMKWKRAIVVCQGGVVTTGTDVFCVDGDGHVGIGATTDQSNTLGAGLTLANSKNIILQTGAGTKIGTAASQKLGFWNATPVVQPTVTGSRGGNAALASALTALASMGLIVNSSTA